MTAPGRPPAHRPAAGGVSRLRFRPPRYGLGGGPIGDLPDTAGDAQAVATIDAAYGAGIRFFETAPRYGLGRAEQRLGTALGRHPRADYLVSTRVGELIADGELRHDFSADGIRRSLEESLQRLGLEAVDLVLIEEAEHRWTGAYPALHELRQQGAVRAIGAGTNQPAEVERLVRETDLDVVLLTGRYTLLDQSAEPLLHLCRERGVAVIVAGVFHGGLLSGHAGAPAEQDVLTRTRRITAVCERYGVSLPQAALAFPARHPAVTSILVSAASPAEIRADAVLARKPVPPDLWRELSDQGLVSRSDLP